MAGVAGGVGGGTWRGGRGSVVFAPDFFDIGAAVVDEDTHFDRGGGVGSVVDLGIGHGGELEGEGAHVGARGVAGTDGVVVDALVEVEEGLLEGLLYLVGGDVFGGGVELPVDGAVDGVGFLAGGGG